MSDDERREVMEEPRRGRGRPQNPVVPPPPWPAVTGKMELLSDAFKRAGEVIEGDFGRVPAKPATFVYGRSSR